MKNKNNFSFPTKIQAILNEKCPRCRKGDIFFTPWYNIKQFHKTRTHCPHCGFQYEVEPGFFWGAMYISYAMAVALWIAISLIFYFFFPDTSIWTQVIFTLIINILLIPWMYRYSRALMLHWFAFVPFDESLCKQEQSQSPETIPYHPNHS